ncbi:acyl-CoA dehydrogenase family protein [Sporichthya brevicatena]|uniref:Acyl-CoA dehydrogenase family protein n=1 Tax=Sporichthya brevicatena TaxID=171442 RepID=A0ABN1HB64_9ACTN
MADPLLLSTVDDLLADLCTAEALAGAEQDGWAGPIWDAVEEMGLSRLGIDEQSGGVGGEFADAIAVLGVVGRYAAPVPLAESVLAGWLLSSARLVLGPGLTTVVPGRPEDTVRLEGGALSGDWHRVPWARRAGHVVALVEDRDSWWVVRVDAAACDVEHRANLAGEPRDTLRLDRVGPLDLVPAPVGARPADLRARGALTRAAMMSGALDAIGRLTSSHAQERRQFGRALSSFQAVQAHLVVVAQQAALVAMATGAAARALERGSGTFEIGAAKVLADRAAGVATAAAHQTHGAIGMTYEHHLQHLTRRLWSWRQEYGRAREWSSRLGWSLHAAGADHLYPVVAGTPGGR